MKVPYQLPTRLTDMLYAYRSMSAEYLRSFYRRNRHAEDSLATPLDFYYRDPKWSLRSRKCCGGNWEEWPRADTRPDFTWDRKYFCDNFDNFRLVGDANELYQYIEHSGYYLDPIYCDGDLVIGVVLQLPARKGKPCYIPAVRFTESDGVTVWPLDTYDNKEEAAQSADENARIYAEHEKEYRTKEYAKGAIESLHEANVGAIKRVHELKMDIRSVDELPPAVCETVRTEILNLRNQVTQNIIQIKTIRDNEYVVVEQALNIHW